MLPPPRWVSGIPATTRARPPSSASVKPPGPVNVALSTPWPAGPAFTPAPLPCGSAANGVISGSPNTVCFSSVGSDWRESRPRTRAALCSDSMALSALLPDLLCDVCICKEICSDFGAQTEEAEVAKGETIRARSTIKEPQPRVPPCPP